MLFSLLQQPQGQIHVWEAPLQLLSKWEFLKVKEHGGCRRQTNSSCKCTTPIPEPPQGPAHSKLNEPQVQQVRTIASIQGFKKKKKAHWDVDGDGVAPTDQFGENYLILSGTSGKEPAHQCRRCKGLGFDPWGRKIPWRRAWQPTPAFLPGESPWTEEPGGLQSIGLQRVRHIWSDLASTPSIFSNIEASNPSTWDVSPCI